MRIERRLLDWGAFLVALGAVPLLVQLGWLERATVGDAWRLWPVFLIVAGLGLIVGRGRLLGGLLVAIVSGLIIGGVVGGGIGTVGCGLAGGTPAPLATRSGSFGAAASVDLTLDCGNTTVSTTEGSGWTVGGTGDPAHPPSVEADSDSLAIGPADSGGLFGFNLNRSNWLVTLPSAPGLDLSLTLNAGTSRLNLAGAHLTGLSLTGNAGSVRVDLSSAASVGNFDATVNAGDVLVALPDAALAASVTVNAGHLGFCLPPGVGLQVQAGGALSSNNFASRGLIRAGDTWTNAAYASAAVRINLQATANAGHLELDPKGGCQ